MISLQHISDPLNPLVILAGCWVGCWVVERVAGDRLRDLVRMIRMLLIPCYAVTWALGNVLGFAKDDSLYKVAETIIGFAVVWCVVSVLQLVVLSTAVSSEVRARIPRLLIDIVRIVFVTIGAVMVFSGIWHKDLSALLATFGVGSLVLGLALQDTLGNLFAGLALVFERPLSVGDWIQLGDTVGRVTQINWRSVRIVTRELNEVTIPNSAIGKERIMNFSTPSRVHGLKVTFGFSYDAPPNVVKEMLFATAMGTPGVLATPAPEVRTIDFGAYAVQYELRFFIGDYDQYVAVRNELMTRVWYAARRHNISIPYPITTMYKTEIPYLPVDGNSGVSLTHLIRSTELFQDLSDAEAESLAGEVEVLRFARGEVLVREGEQGECFFIVTEGLCSVEVSSANGGRIAVATIGKGAVVGEMALLSGTPRSATVVASSDVVAARFSRVALGHLLARRADIAKSFAHYAAEHAKELENARSADAQLEKTKSGAIDEFALGERIKRFFGIG